MKTPIPGTPRALHGLLLPRLLIAGLAIGLFAGIASCYLETRQVEVSAFELAITNECPAFRFL